MGEVIYIPDDDEIVILDDRSHGRMPSPSSEIDWSLYPIQDDPQQDVQAEGFLNLTARHHAADNAWEQDFAKLPQVVLQQENLMANVGADGVARIKYQPDPEDWQQYLMDDYNGPNTDMEGWNSYADPGLIYGYNQGQLDVSFNPRVKCIDEVIDVFPDICRDYVSELYDSDIVHGVEQLIEHILDNVEKGTSYPKAKDKLNSLKRKREIDPEEEEENNYGSADREDVDDDYAMYTRMILSAEFNKTPMPYVDSTLFQTKSHLFPAYRILEEAQRTWNEDRPEYTKLKYARKTGRTYTPQTVEETLQLSTTPPALVQSLRELQAAWRMKRRAQEKRDAEAQIEREEEENVKAAIAEGTMSECGCCFGEYPLNRMIHCENDDIHWFCRPCARSTADNEIGNQKYEIKCMSMDGCDAGFSISQKRIFLDESSLIALDRNEQKAMLRLAGIENLESCPFCPFAAEYPSVAEDKEFRCQAADCEKVSCRLCRLESHIPKTCEESAKDNGLSIRRQIEEAMSAALIRRCNKCATPFVKEEGCNKMTCSTPGCGNVQCYVCSKSCTYDHFDDRSRGGRQGNCPLFENVAERHEMEVTKAEKEALDRARAQHPEYTEDDLKVKVSEKVKQDEELRKARDPRNTMLNMMRGGPPGFGGRMQVLGDIRPRPVGQHRADLAVPMPQIRQLNIANMRPMQLMHQMQLPELDPWAEAEVEIGLLLNGVEHQQPGPVAAFDQAPPLYRPYHLPVPLALVQQPAQNLARGNNIMGAPLQQNYAIGHRMQQFGDERDQLALQLPVPQPNFPRPLPQAPAAEHMPIRQRRCGRRRP